MPNDTKTQTIHCVCIEVMQLAMLGCYVSEVQRAIEDHCDHCPDCAERRRQVAMSDARIDAPVLPDSIEHYNARVYKHKGTGVVHAVPFYNNVIPLQTAHLCLVGNIMLDDESHFVVPISNSPVGEELRILIEKDAIVTIPAKDPSMELVGGFGIRPTMYLLNRISKKPYPNYNVTKPFRFVTGR